MILRQLIAIFLIQTMLLTSINAYIPQHLQENFNPSSMSAFLMNEDRELRCQLTSEAAELLSLEQLQGLAQNNALAVMIGDSPANEFRPCGEDDVKYAKIVFANPNLASGQPSFGIILLYALALGIFSTALGYMVSKILKDDDQIQNSQETIKAICGEKNALVTQDGVQCLDE